MRKALRMFEEMNEAEDIREFPFVAAMPKREKSRMQTLFDDMEAFSEMQRKRPMVPAVFAAKMLDVTPQRVNELMNIGTLDRIKFNDHTFVPIDSLVGFCKTDRKAGRPRKLGMIDRMKLVCKLGTEIGETLAERAAEK